MKKRLTAISSLALLAVLCVPAYAETAGTTGIDTVRGGYGTAATSGTDAGRTVTGTYSTYAADGTYDRSYGYRAAGLDYDGTYRAAAVDDTGTDWGWLGLLGLVGLAGLFGRNRAEER